MYCRISLAGADLGGGGGGWAVTFEVQIFAAAATPLHDVSKISLGPPPPSQILDPHLP